MVTVDHQRCVTLYGDMQDVYSDRPCLAVVEPLKAAEFQFGNFMPVEQFIIGLQSCFAREDGRDIVIEAIAGLKSDESMSYKDDGISQTVAAKKGVSLSTTREVPNPVVLKPYRTFPEIEQPSSQFILRVTDKRGEPEVGLWEADGGAWKIEATARIRAWLEAQLSGTGIDVLG